MSVHTYTPGTIARCVALINAAFDQGIVPVSVFHDATTVTLTYVPDLTAQQANLLDDLAKSSTIALSASEYEALKPKIAEIRTFRTRTMAQWNALTAANREADEISYLNDLTDVLRALLRD